MQAATLSIGDELVLGQIRDSNARWLAGALLHVGVTPAEHRAVRDDRQVLAATIRELAERYDVVLMTGGLGPTEDDLTRDALADVFTPGEACIIDGAALCALEERWSRRGVPFPPSNRRQAMRPSAMSHLANPHGTAPGLIGTWSSCLIAAMPGPPNEMVPMFDVHVAPRLQRQQRIVVRTATIHAFGLGESIAAERLGAMTDRSREPLIGTTASRGVVTARLRARGDVATVDVRLDDDRRAIESLWSPYAFGRDDDTLVSVVADLLEASTSTLATAESCTGGLLGAMIVERGGASAFYAGGWVTYSNALKQHCLDVPADVLETHGAVSSIVAEAMADGARRHSGATYALSTTGIAGPEGGRPDKPVGTVFIGLAGPDRVIARRFEFPGDRDIIRDRTAKSALQMLRFELLGVNPDTRLLWDVIPEPAPHA